MKIVRSFALTRESNPRAQQSYVGLHHHQSILYIYTIPLNFVKTSQLQTKKRVKSIKNLLNDFIFRLVFHVHYETMIDLGRNFLLAPNFFLL